MQRPELPPEKRPSVTRAQTLPKSLGLEIAGGVEHLLHAGATARAFVADEDDIAGNDAVAEDGLDGGVLALEDARGAGEGEVGGVDAGGLDDASFFGDVAVEDGEAAILAEGVFDVADDSGVAVEVEIGIAGGLAEGDRGADAEGRGAEELVDGGSDAALDVERVDGLAEGGRVDGVGHRDGAGRRGPVRRGWP